MDRYLKSFLWNWPLPQVNKLLLQCPIVFHTICNIYLWAISNVHNLKWHSFPLWNIYHNLKQHSLLHMFKQPHLLSVTLDEVSPQPVTTWYPTQEQEAGSNKKVKTAPVKLHSWQHSLCCWLPKPPIVPLSGGSLRGIIHYIWYQRISLV